MPPAVFVASINKPASTAASASAFTWRKKYKFLMPPHYLCSCEEALEKSGSTDRQSSYDRNKDSNML